MFVEPHPSGNVFHRVVINDALDLDIPTFAGDLIESARVWLAEAAVTENYQRNVDRFLTRHANGIPPYIVGAPVVG